MGCTLLEVNEAASVGDEELVNGIRANPIAHKSIRNRQGATSLGRKV
jgi:hypothetical protein